MNLHDRLGDNLFNLDEVVGAVGEDQLDVTTASSAATAKKTSFQSMERERMMGKEDGAKKTVADIAGFDKKLSAREKVGPVERRAQETNGL